MDCLKPTFGAGRALSEQLDLALHLIYSIFGSSELHRQLVRQPHGAVAVFIRLLGGALDVCSDGLSVLFHRSVISVGPWLRFKFNDLFGCVGAVFTHWN